MIYSKRLENGKANAFSYKEDLISLYVINTVKYSL